MRLLQKECGKCIVHSAIGLFIVRIGAFKLRACRLLIRHSHMHLPQFLSHAGISHIGIDTQKLKIA